MEETNRLLDKYKHLIDVICMSTPKKIKYLVFKVMDGELYITLFVTEGKSISERLNRFISHIKRTLLAVSYQYPIRIQVFNYESFKDALRVSNHNHKYIINGFIFDNNNI